MAKSEILVGLDIGTTKVCAVVGRTQDSRVEIMGVGLAPCHGLRKGVVVDLEQTVAAIREAVSKAQRMAGVEMISAWVGITGEHVFCQNSRGVVSVSRPDHQIEPQDVERVMRAADQGVMLPADREMVHNISRSFIIDGQDGVKNPVGMSATRLEVETHVVMGATNFIQNVEKCVERAELSVEDIVLEPIATGEAVLTPAERELGAVLIDLGGGTTDLAIFCDGSVCYSGAVPVAGNHVTRDIAVGMRVTPEEAERLKIASGCTLLSMLDPEELIRVSSSNQPEPIELPRSLLAEIIEPRMREIFDLVRTKIDGSGYQNSITSGGVLTGGASQLPGTAQLAQEVLGFPVRVGQPTKIAGLADAVRSPIYSTGVGLVLYAAAQKQVPWAVSEGKTVGSLLGRIRRWLRDLFSP